jgi:phosphatidylglycerophosphate synthase
MDPAAKLPGKLKTVFQNAGASIITLLAVGLHLELLSLRTLRLISIPLLSLMVAVSLGSMYWYLRPLVEQGREAPEKRTVRKQRIRLLIATVLPLLLVYCLYTGSVAVVFRLGIRDYAVYLVFNFCFHGLVFLSSLIVGKEFRFETTGDALKRINLPLFLSFARICSIPTLVFLFLKIAEINATLAIVPLLTFLFLTDLLDGFLARTLQQTTRIGRILDPAGDYALIVAISWVFLIIDFIPIWLFLLVMVRLLVQAIGTITLYFLRGYSYLKLSFLGKTSVFTVFTIYGIELLEYLGVPGLNRPGVMIVLEILAAGVVGVSLLEKVISLQRSFRRAFRELRDLQDQ